MNDPVRLPLLDQVRVASPCPAQWDDMPGDDRARHCAMCDLDVFDLSSMARAEAEAFLSARLGGAGARPVCARFYRRADGTILTRDCPVGLRAARSRVARGLSRIAAALALLLAGGAALGSGGASRTRLRDLHPYSRLISLLNPIAPAFGPLRPPVRTLIMGAVALPPLSPPMQPPANPAPKPVAPDQTTFGGAAANR